jgi:uncharacterized membrane protein HdeD (DUF308 family)
MWIVVDEEHDHANRRRRTAADGKRKPAGDVRTKPASTNKSSDKKRGFSMDSKIVSRIWWSLAFRGVLAILFGIVALIYTGQTLLALIYVFGVFAVLGGITSLVTAVRAGEAHQRWGWLAASGILSVAAGVVAFVWPGITALAFV